VVGHVQSLDEGDTLYSLNAHRLQVPASVQKLLVAGAAAERLGWGFQFTTRLRHRTDRRRRYRRPPVVTSDGDPTISPRHPQRWGALTLGQTAGAGGLRQLAGS
jgi:D-alanyl-D-alanine carboxypeptidase